MNLYKYVKRREILSDLNISEISDKKRYNKEKNDYKKLIKISDDFKNEKHQDKSKNFFLNKFFIIGLSIFLAILFSLGYIDSQKNQINILFFILMIIIFPFILVVFSFLNTIYKKQNSSCFKSIIEFLMKKEIEKDALQKVSCFYLQIVSIVFSSISILILLFWTAIENYKFYFATTWLESSFFINLISFFSFPMKSIFPQLIPNTQMIIEASKNASSDSIWLWFLIMLLLIWIIIPRVVILILTYYFSRKALQESFITNEKSKRILEYLKPKITTTSYDNDRYEENKKEDESKNNQKKQKLSNEQSNQNYLNILLFHLNENAINAIKVNKKYSNAMIQTYHRNMDFKQFHSEVLILINIQSSPKMIAVNMMRKLSHCNIVLGFVDDNALEVKEDSNIEEWKRFLKHNNIEFKVKDEH